VVVKVIRKIPDSTKEPKAATYGCFIHSSSSTGFKAYVMIKITPGEEHPGI